MTDQETKAELKQKTDFALSEYYDELDKIAADAGMTISSTRAIQENPDTRQAGAAAWAQFKARQDELEREYMAPRDAAALRHEKAEHDAAKHDALLDQAYDNLEWAIKNLNNERNRLAAMRDAGIVVSSDEADQIKTTAQAQIDHWSAEIDRLYSAPAE